MKNLSNHRLRQRNRCILLEVLLSNPCLHCGEDDILVLEFDHMRDKHSHVGRLALNVCSVGRLMVEVFKCRILCSNCHTRATRRDNNDFRWRFSNEDTDKEGA